MSDSITILHSHGRRLAKAIHPNGQVDAYDKARTFDIGTVAVRDLDHLAARLAKLATRPDLCIVRGKPVDPARTNSVRRLFHPDAKAGDDPTIEDGPRCWVALDVEGVLRPADVSPTDLAACARCAIDLLPGEFRTARVIVQATSGHGLKPDIRLRLWFWSDRPLSGSELSYWFRRSPVDCALFRPAQVIYTADPVSLGGRVDHLPTRMIIMPGEPMVIAPETLLPPPRPVPPPRPIRVDSNRAEKLLTTVLLNLETAPPGQRHERLRAAARTIGGLMDGLGISHSDAEGCLLAAARRAGGPEFSEPSKLQTINWALERGRREPLDVGGGHGRA